MSVSSFRYHINGALLVLSALVFAISKHRGQTRKFSKLPFVFHPITACVTACLYYAKYRNEFDSSIITIYILAAATLLHDVIEECNVCSEELNRRFGEIVTCLILKLTNDEAEIARIGKQLYTDVKLAELGPVALFIKLVDILSNIRDNPALKYLVRIQHNYHHLLEHTKTNRLNLAHYAILREIHRVLSRTHHRTLSRYYAA